MTCLTQNLGTLFRTMAPSRLGPSDAPSFSEVSNQFRKGTPWDDQRKVVQFFTFYETVGWPINWKVKLSKFKTKYKPHV